MDAPTLLAAVEREFAVTGAATARWADPHPDGAAARDEEYSRVTDPAKYRIVAARAEAWARVLERSGLATREPLRDPSTVWDEAARAGDYARVAERGTWLRPHAAGALPLLFALRSVDAPDNHLDVGAGDPPRLLDDVPDCGCDACDSGSAGLLEVIDDAVLDVVSGALVHVLVDGSTAIAGRDRWSARAAGAGMVSRSRVDEAIAAVRAGTWPGPALHGRSWLDR